jgi:hypothetical protein
VLVSMEPLVQVPEAALIVLLRLPTVIHPCAFLLEFSLNRE